MHNECAAWGQEMIATYSSDKEAGRVVPMGWMVENTSDNVCCILE